MSKKSQKSKLKKSKMAMGIEIFRIKTESLKEFLNTYFISDSNSVDAFMDSLKKNRSENFFQIENEGDLLIQDYEELKSQLSKIHGWISYGENGENIFEIITQYLKEIKANTDDIDDINKLMIVVEENTKKLSNGLGLEIKKVSPWVNGMK